MAKAIATTDGFKFVFDDGQETDIQLRVDPTHGTNLLEVVASRDGVELGTPFRLKGSESGQRIAADLPGVSNAYFITDENGHITNG